MSEGNAALTAQVDHYVRGYLTLESQPAAEGTADPQLATVAIPLSDRISSAQTGSILDIGCGQGSLLKRLTEIPAFMHTEGWLYVAVDVEQALDDVHKLSRAERVTRRTELIELGDFYASWPNFGSVQIVFCRNVLHELDVIETSALLRHMAANISSDDFVIIQDLMKLPVGERKSACWAPDLLRDCLSDFGFLNVAVVEQPTRSGNAWFSITSSGSDRREISSERALEIVTLHRQNQWKIWAQIESEAQRDLPGRHELIEAIDLDLQLASLTRQLMNEGVKGLSLNPDTERRIRSGEFSKRVEAFVKENASPPEVTITEHVHFRERGEQLTLLEDFLRSDERIAIVHGGSGTGKTTVVQRILSTRAYEKCPVFIDGRKVTSFWAFIEEVFSQVGLRLAPELLSVLSDLSIHTFETALRQFMNAYVGRIILFYDNFSLAQDSNGNLADPALEAALELWAGKSAAKIILGSRSEYVPGPIQKAAGGLPKSVRVGRYASERTVVNVLDDSFDRKAAGLDEYPERLLAAIDRHPLIASLAAQNLKKHGSRLLLNDAFVQELRGKLREELWNRLVDEGSRATLALASRLRVAVPEVLLTNFVNKDSVRAALAGELLHESVDNRWGKLFSVLGLFRVRSLNDEIDFDETRGEDQGLDHEAVADAYKQIYRIDDDPKWIRESYYHLMLAGGPARKAISGSLGAYYYDELVASADYEYARKRDYGAALELYEIARGIRPLRQSSEMRRAACLIRTRDREPGERAYQDLVKKYPDVRGIKTSHVDALLYVGEFSAAKDALERYELTPQTNSWTAYEWGRAYLGLDLYEDASAVLGPLATDQSTDSHFHDHYARALYQAGAFDEAKQILRVTLSRLNERFSDVIGLGTALGIILEQRGDLAAAAEILEPLFAERNDNIRAAASLIRLYRLQGRRPDAEFTYRKAVKNAPKQFREYALAAQVEMLLANKQGEAAVDAVLSNHAENAYWYFLLFRTYNEYIDQSIDGSSIDIANMAMRVVVQPRFKRNALVQTERAKIAARISPEAFARLLGELETQRLIAAVQNELNPKQ